MHLFVLFLFLTIILLIVIIAFTQFTSNENFSLTFPIDDVLKAYDNFEFISSYEAIQNNMFSKKHLLYVFYASNPKQDLANKYFFIVLKPPIYNDLKSLDNEFAHKLFNNVLIPLLGGRKHLRELSGKSVLVPIFGKEEVIKDLIPNLLENQVFDYYQELVKLKEGFHNTYAILQKAIPFVKVQEFRFEKDKEGDNHKKTYLSFAFDTLCFTHKDIGKDGTLFWKSLFDSYFNSNHDIYENSGAINLYTKHGFDSVQHLPNLQQDPKLSNFLVEAFDDNIVIQNQKHAPPIEFNLNTPAKGLQLLDYSKFFYKQFHLDSVQDNVLLSPNDIIHLRNQNFSYENCTLIMLTNEIGSTGLKLKWSSKNMSIHGNTIHVNITKHIREMFKFLDFKRLKNFYLHVYHVPEHENITGKIIAPSDNHILCSFKSDTSRYNDKFTCLDKDKSTDSVFVDNKEQCENYNGFWDRPCFHDTECPHFLPQHDWGCQNGFCKMPLNVKRKGFRHAEDSNHSYPLVCDSLVEPEYAKDCYQEYRKKQLNHIR